MDALTRTLQRTLRPQQRGEYSTNIGGYCKRAVVAIASNADAAEAAQLMRSEHLGFLIVYREKDELQRRATPVAARS